MPPLFMYERWVKFRTIAPASPVSSYALISTLSEPAVTSPRMSTMLAWPWRRTSNVAVTSGIGVPFRAADGAFLIWVDRQEVGEPGDLEDLAVVRTQAVRPDVEAGRPRACQQTDDQRDARGVDVARGLEVQDDRVRPVARGARPGGLERLLGAAVDVPREVDHRHPVAPADRRNLTRRHRRLPPGAGRARACDARPRSSRASRRPCSRSARGPSRAGAGARRAWPRGPVSRARAPGVRRPG